MKPGAAVPAGLAGSALRVALRRAAHQLVDRPIVFEDPYAAPLLAARYGPALQRTPIRMRAEPSRSGIRHGVPSTKDRSWSRALRAFVVARSRYAEDLLALAVTQGVRQYCLLGAGLDTFAWRNPHSALRVWQVDRPAMLAWKHELAAEAGLPAPARSCSVAADLGDPDLAERLASAGLRPHQPAFFTMLGVASYLPAPTFTALAAMARTWASGSGLVFDYRLPRASLDEQEQRQHDSAASRLAAAGEPFQSAWTPDAMTAELSSWHSVEQLGSDAVNARYFAGRADGFQARGNAWRIVGAQSTPSTST